jgi:hypothetical protein
LNVVLHWVIERRHRDGSWQACYSMLFYKRQRLRDQDAWNGVGEDPRDLLSSYDVKHLDVLTGATGWRKKASRVALSGTPMDLSQYTQSAIRWDSIKNPGHFTLARYIDAGRGFIPGFSPADQRILRDRLSILENILSQPGWMDQVLIGDIVDNSGLATHPYLDNESAHERLHREAYAEGLEPIDGASVRFIIGLRG